MMVSAFSDENYVDLAAAIDVDAARLGWHDQPISLNDSLKKSGC
jgi:hypothetical protein